jgi:hypothetical protein
MMISRFAAVAVFTMLASAASAQTRLPAQMPIENERGANLTELVISDAEGKAVARLTKPLAAGKKTTLKFAKAKGCEMTVSARFDDEGEVDEVVNLCREKRIRFKE